jgi:hypothetical protein
MTVGPVPRGVCIGLLLAAATLGCSSERKASTAIVDEALVRKYQSVLEKMISANEELVDILKTIDAGAASREKAKLRLADLSERMDKILAELNALRGLDYESRAEAKARITQRHQAVNVMLSKQIQRINDLPGGQDFFQNDLRQLVDTLKKSQ